jgi:hypothetical protein
LGHGDGDRHGARDLLVGWDGGGGWGALGLGGLAALHAAAAHGFEELGGGGQARVDVDGAEVEGEVDLLGNVREGGLALVVGGGLLAPWEAESDFELVGAAAWGLVWGSGKRGRGAYLRLHVTKLGMTVLGREKFFQSVSGTTTSVPTASPGQETGMERPCELRMIQREVSVWIRSWHRTTVSPIKSTCRAMRKISASTAASFLASSRRGIGLLHVRMAGWGIRADISISGPMSGDTDPGEGCTSSFPSAVGAVMVGDCSAPLDWREEWPPVQLNSEGRFLTSGRGLGSRLRGRKVKGRLAYASWFVRGGRGGSMGRNLRPMWYRQFSRNMPGRWIVTLT